MREIKFRAWNKHHRILCKVATLILPPSEHPGVVTDLDIIIFKEKMEKENLLPYWPMVDIELMQFTGLRDKNGKEIYEGDVLRTGMRREDPSGWTVEFVEYRNGEYVLTGKTLESMQMQKDQELREVIGNIWENPELLKEPQ